MGELKSNVTITAEQIFFHQLLSSESAGKHIIPDADEYRKYLLSEQNVDGSWAIAAEYPGDVSTSSEAYLALKILGLSEEAPEMQRAREFIRQCGGVAKARVFTRIFFAQFGLFPWDAVPQLPAEFILVPSSAPLNLYKLSSWARASVVPLLIIAHHRPIYALPNGRSSTNPYLDELWLDPQDKMVFLGPSLLDPRSTDMLSYVFTAVDRALYYLGGLRRNPLRSYARRQCVNWILERQEKTGGWAGIMPAMHAGVQALLLEGYTMDSDPVRRGMAAIEAFTWYDGDGKGGKRLQCCISPVWDTVLMIRGLRDAGVAQTDERLTKAVLWAKKRQLHGPEGDWRVYSPALSPGGFCFQYHNAWFPDVDDTAAAILAFVKKDPAAIDSSTVVSAALWICGMQNRDGGWAAFDKENNKLWLNKLPFSDMDSLCDPSTADLTGRIVEAFGLMMRTARSGKEHINAGLLDRISGACERAIGFLASEQEASGAWFGRWGCNYVYGTSNVLCGLEYFAHGSKNRQVKDMMAAGTSWLKDAQNEDGGWGEVLQTYGDPSLAGQGPSTASQTAWGLMGLLTTCGADDAAVLAGASYLAEKQTDSPGEGKGASWPEKLYTGIGFPNFFYINYDLYRHYFPLMALGRFLQAAEGEDVEERCAGGGLDKPL